MGTKLERPDTVSSFSQLSTGRNLPSSLSTCFQFPQNCPRHRDASRAAVCSSSQEGIAEGPGRAREQVETD